MIEAALPFPNIDPVLIHIYGPISIRWYALSYIAGLLLGWAYVVRLLRTQKLWAGRPFMGKPPATPDDIAGPIALHIPRSGPIEFLGHVDLATGGQAAAV